MIIQNTTKLSTDLLRQIIVETSDIIGCDFKRVFFKFSVFKKEVIRGYSVRCKAVPSYFIYRDGRRNEAVDLNGGYICIRIPLRWFSEIYSIYASKELVKGLLHELRHIKDFQEGLEYSDANMRKRWKNRPWEIEAIKAEDNISLVSKDLIEKLANNFKMWYNIE